jgi:hypothetical protein
MFTQMLAQIPIAINKADFLTRVELLVRNDKLRYSEAICQICHELSLDTEDVVLLISDTLKERLRLDAIRNKGITGSKNSDLTTYL